MFHVGQLVVCVDDNTPIPLDNWPLRRGTIYTVRWIGVLDSGIGPDGMYGEFLCLILGEVPGIDIFGETCAEQGYAASRFRPVNPRRIEVFTQLLVTPPRESAKV